MNAHPLFFACGLALAAVLSASAQTAGTGRVEGRVFNATNGNALANARVTLEGAARETITDESGSFRFAGVSAGEARLAVSYVGMAPQSATVRVSAGGTVQREFELTIADSRAAGEVVKLDAFTIVADREMSAQAIAMNEQRAAPNLKNVVAIDEFGDRGNENIGEFLLFLPGVSIETSGAEPASVSLRGFPGNNSGLQIDGGEIAGAFTGNSRELDLREVPMNNISRVEVTKVPTPDMPASALGGTINLISRSGFESRKARFNFNAYTLFHSGNGLTFDGGPRNHSPDTSPAFIQPSFDFNYVRPITPNLAITVGGGRAWRANLMDRGDDSDESAVWHLVGGFQRESQWQNLAQIFLTLSGQVGVDWRISPANTLSASFQYRDYLLTTTRSVVTVNYGAGATGNADFTQGATTGVGTVTQNLNGGNGESPSLTRHATLKFRHRGDVWRADAAGSASLSSRRMIGTDYFNTISANITNLIVRGEGITRYGGIIPTRYSATTRTGVPVDLYDGGNYTINNGVYTSSPRSTDRKSGRLDAARDFATRWPVTLKVGTAIDHTTWETKNYATTYNFRPNGATDAASRLASRFNVFDEAYDAVAPTLYGVPMRWVSNRKLYELMQRHPSWFVADEPLAHQDSVNGSREFRETVTAAYVRADVRLLQNKLWLVGGVRFERTDNEGRGPLNDINAQYQRNPNGSFVRNAAGQRVLITSDTLALRKLRFQERGAYAKRNYDDFYPSLNATYNLSDNLVLRAAYARALGRPNISFITPGTTISDSDATNPTITVNNTSLQPWTADGYDFALESYHLKNGFGSVGVFQKNIKNFFGTETTQATPELLDLYGLEGDPAYLAYSIATRTNAGDAKITGLEFSYRQSLTFLPSWARGLQVFANATKLRLSGSNTADFNGYTPQSVAAGINFIRARYFIKMTVSHLGETKGSLVAVNVANGIPADTYNYQGKRTRWGANAQYSLSKRYSLYISATDIGGFVQNLRRYAPTTPEYARDQRTQKLGYYLTVGVRGTF